MTERRSPSLYGLLHVGEPKDRHANLRSGAGKALEIYAANAVTLANSARAQGMEFALVTNDADQVEAALASQGLSGTVPLRQQDFDLDVPDALPFRSAHFKLELIRAFGTGAFGDFPALVDLDSVVMRPVALPALDAFWAYDISAQIWCDRPDADAIRSLEFLAGGPLANPRWFGGEFLAGTVQHFARLAQEIEAIWPSYIAEAGSHFHTGDEMVLTAALNRLAAQGFPIADAGQAGLVSRWWSRRTVNLMPGLGHALSCAILHLPADKPWLAALARHSFDPAKFAADFRRHAASRIPAERAKTFIERLLGRTPQVVPHLA